jgi:hypothetical protein
MTEPITYTSDQLPPLEPSKSDMASTSDAMKLLNRQKYIGMRDKMVRMTICAYMDRVFCRERQLAEALRELHELRQVKAERDLAHDEMRNLYKEQVQDSEQVARWMGRALVAEFQQAEGRRQGLRDAARYVELQKSGRALLNHETFLQCIANELCAMASQNASPAPREEK